jgi:hypothetical protein
MRTRVAANPAAVEQREIGGKFVAIAPERCFAYHATACDDENVSSHLTKEVAMGEHKEPQSGTSKPDVTKKTEIADEDLKNVSGGLNPQPLPPKTPPPGDPARNRTRT